MRYALATHRPADATPESSAARLRWLPLEEALTEVTESNLLVCLERIARLGL